jgi:hypothetical protein
MYIECLAPIELETVEATWPLQHRPGTGDQQGHRNGGPMLERETATATSVGNWRPMLDQRGHRNIGRGTVTAVGNWRPMLDQLGHRNIGRGTVGPTRDQRDHGNIGRETDVGLTGHGNIGRELETDVGPTRPSATSIGNGQDQRGHRNIGWELEPTNEVTSQPSRTGARCWTNEVTATSVGMQIGEIDPSLSSFVRRFT